MLDQHTSAGVCSSAGKPNKSNGYFCAICGATFSREKDCDDHEVYGHFYCWDCDQKFSTWDATQQVRAETPPSPALSLS